MNKHTFGNSFIVVFIVISITFCAWWGLLVLLGGPGPPGPPLGYGPGYRPLFRYVCALIGVLMWKMYVNKCLNCLKS